MFDLATFSVENKVMLAGELRRCGAGAEDIYEAAGCLARTLYERLGDSATGRPACALVRVYRTSSYYQLDPEQQAFADRLLGEREPWGAMKVLTLLGTAGDLPEWRSVESSAAHRAVPLASKEMVRQSPMVSQLISQLGMDVASVLDPDPKLIADLEQREYNVFYVPSAPGSPYVPAQEEFVARHGIVSALGFGGLFATGDLFAVVLFSKVFVPEEVAAGFKTLAITVKTVLLSAGLVSEAV